MTKDGNPLLEKLTPILVLTSIGLAFTVGILWQKIANLEGGGSNVKVAANNGGQGQAVPTVNPAQMPTSGKMTDEQAANVPPISDGDHIRGSRNAQVFLIEYSDYQCPFCSRFHPTAQQVLDEYGDKVAWVYRHFPLDQLHPKARPAAEASECVAELGGEDAFWSFSDAIYEDQTRLDDLESIVSGIGINLDSYKSCVEDGKYTDKVNDQYQGGLTAGITGTPGNIVMNQKDEAWLIPGALPFEQIKTTIDEALGS